MAEVYGTLMGVGSFADRPILISLFNSPRPYITFLSAIAILRLNMPLTVTTKTKKKARADTVGSKPDA